MYRVGLLVSVVMAFGCGKKTSAADEFKLIAGVVKSPVDSMQKLHKDILPKEMNSDNALSTMAAGYEACLNSKEPAQALTDATFEPALEAEKLTYDVIRGAASSHLSTLQYKCNDQELRQNGDFMAGSARCHRECMKTWVNLVKAIDEARKRAEPLGVDVPAVAH